MAPGRRRAPGSRPSKTKLVLPLVAAALLVSCTRQGERRAAPRSTSSPDAFASIEARASAPAPAAKAAPRWEQVAVLTGSGPHTRPLSISKDAIQWRAEWSCGSGTMRLETDPAPRNGGPIAENECPGTGLAYGVRKGAVRLTVANQGEWKVVVSQQVTTPVDEPRLPEMSAPGARVMAGGEFFAVERKGKGKALLYRLADGALGLRLEGFQTSANTDLYVWVSESARPATSKEALDSPHVEIAELKSTIGNQNYRLPGGLDPAKIRSVVIWCRPVQIAYVASALEPVPG